MMAVEWGLWLIAVVWFLLAAVFTWSSLQMRRLPNSPPVTFDPAVETVSAIMAVRDEVDRVEATVRRLLAQRGVNLELIVVDDRSGDGTNAVLSRLVPEFERLTVVRVDQLPEGWLGKCHALAAGAQHASGRWFLFVDGDIWLANDAVGRAVACAVAGRVDHVSLTPRLEPQDSRLSLAAKACLLAIHLPMGLVFALVNRDWPRVFAGVGAFNLVRADLYREFGGYERLKLEVADDMKLGLLVRRQGGRTRMMLGEDAVESHWASTARQIVKALEKNGFSAMNYRVSKAIFVTLPMAAAWLGAVIGPLTGTRAGLAAGLGLAAIIVPAAVQARLMRWPFWLALGVPVSLWFIPVALWNSIVVTLRQGGVRWRDTFYPLAALREGQVK